MNPGFSQISHTTTYIQVMKTWQKAQEHKVIQYVHVDMYNKVYVNDCCPYGYTAAVCQWQ